MHVVSLSGRSKFTQIMRDTVSLQIVYVQALVSYD